jgi:glycosyltransferase involved in cell wall biosynthesis
MNVAFLTPEYPLPGRSAAGGIGTSIRNLAAGLENAGHRVTILLYGQPDDELVSDGKTLVYAIRNVRFKGISWLLTRKKIQRLINRLHRERAIDLVEAPDWTGITSFISIDCPIVVRLHGSDTYFSHLEGRKVKWLNRFHEKRALQKADGLLSVSAFTAAITKELFSIGRDFTVIPNGVDAGKFRGSAAAVPNRILYFGTLIRKKGALELPHIFNLVHRANPDAELWLVGRDASDAVTKNPSTWALMQPLFDRSAIRKVKYTGGVPYNDMQAHIGDAAVCVFPTFAEALPVSWLEAMAMEKAVVASNIGWAHEIVDDGKDGFLASPSGHRAFAAHIIALLADENLRNATGKAAREKIMERFEAKRIALENIDYYKTLLHAGI